MGEAIAFYTLAAFILGFGVLVISTKNTVHSVLFLVLNFLFVAALYILLGAQFLAAIQILVYAGGIVVLYLFVVMLVNLKRPPEAHQDPRRMTNLGFALAPGCLRRSPLSRCTIRAPRRADRGGGGDPGVRQHRAGRLGPLHELSDSIRRPPCCCSSP